jgi:hypothetical protein
MSVPFVRRESVARRRRLIAGSGLWCLLTLVLMGGAVSSRAATRAGSSIYAQPQVLAYLRTTAASVKAKCAPAVRPHMQLKAVKKCNAAGSKRVRSSRHSSSKWPSPKIAERKGSKRRLPTTKPKSPLSGPPGEVTFPGEATPPTATAPPIAPPTEAPPRETPPVKAPPVKGPPVETPPVETPPVETPPVETPPVETPPVETPPVETPPVETPPVETPPVETPPVETPPVETPAPRMFSSVGVWNARVSGVGSLDPSSAVDVAAFNVEVAKEISNKQLNVNTTAWSVPVYTVPAGQPTVRVLLNKPAVGNPLQTPWNAVPLPANAQPAKGTDKQLVVWQPSTDKLWEFWGFESTLTGPVAQWGGAVEHVSTNPGAYDTSAWKQTIPNTVAWEADIRAWGASGCSLSIAGGLITLEDLERGQINHALALAIPNPRAGVYASPAQRTDGTSLSPLALPEGAHLRLDPTLNLATLHLPRLTLMLAEAAQRYGIVVRDKGGNVAFYAQDPTPTGSNPYTGTNGYFGGMPPYALLASFPWSHLQLLPMQLH